MTAPLYQPMFISPRDIPDLELTDDDTIVFVDDFSGTGDQVVGFWPQTQELIGSEATAYLLLAAATENAVARIEQETSLKVFAGRTLNEKSNIFGGTSTVFGQRQRNCLLKYCTAADKKAPKGYGDCGLLFAFGHTTPNNSIPVLHASKQTWRGLLPRVL